MVTKCLTNGAQGVTIWKRRIFSLLCVDVISDTQVKDPYHMHTFNNCIYKKIYDDMTNDFMQNLHD